MEKKINITQNYFQIMKILVIGGPRFVGYALTDALLKNNHIVTFFNRGKTNPDLFPEVEKIHGNRDGEMEFFAYSLFKYKLALNFIFNNNKSLKNMKD